MFNENQWRRQDFSMEGTLRPLQGNHAPPQEAKGVNFELLKRIKVFENESIFVNF